MKREQTKIRMILILTLLVVSPLLAQRISATNVQGAPKDKLYLVQKIFVGDMGTSDEAARFRLLLEEQLSKRGFTIVDKSESADGILTGVLSLRVYADTSLARATVQLKSPTGERLWGGDFEPKSTFFKKVSDTAKFRAENIAEKLRSDWKKSAKAAGIKAEK